MTFAVQWAREQQAFEAMHLPMVNPHHFFQSPSPENQSLSTSDSSSEMNHLMSACLLSISDLMRQAYIIPTRHDFTCWE